jgi:hypothetical protein
MRSILVNAVASSGKMGRAGNFLMEEIYRFGLWSIESWGCGFTGKG